MRKFVVVLIVLAGLGLGSIALAQDAGLAMDAGVSLPPVQPGEVVLDQAPAEAQNLWTTVRSREWLAAFASFLMLWVLGVRLMFEKSKRFRKWLGNKVVMFVFSVLVIAPVDIATLIKAGEKLTFSSVSTSLLAAALASAGAWGWAKKAKPKPLG